MRDIEAGDVSSAQTTLGRERLSPGREPLIPWGLCLYVMCVYLRTYLVGGLGTVGTGRVGPRPPHIISHFDSRAPAGHADAADGIRCAPRVSRVAPRWHPAGALIHMNHCHYLQS